MKFELLSLFGELTRDFFLQTCCEHLSPVANSLSKEEQTNSDLNCSEMFSPTSEMGQVRTDKDLRGPRMDGLKGHLQTTVWWLPEGGGWEEDEEGKGAQIHGHRRRLDFGW